MLSTDRISKFLKGSAPGTENAPIAADQIAEFLKGKPAAVGEIHHWASGQYQKDVHGWKKIRGDIKGQLEKLHTERETRNLEGKVSDLSFKLRQRRAVLEEIKDNPEAIRKHFSSTEGKSDADLTAAVAVRLKDTQAALAKLAQKYNGADEPRWASPASEKARRKVEEYVSSVHRFLNDAYAARLDEKFGPRLESLFKRESEIQQRMTEISPDGIEDGDSRHKDGFWQQSPEFKSKRAEMSKEYPFDSSEETEYDGEDPDSYESYLDTLTEDALAEEYSLLEDDLMEVVENRSELEEKISELKEGFGADLSEKLSDLDTEASDNAALLMEEYHDIVSSIVERDAHGNDSRFVRGFGSVEEFKKHNSERLIARAGLLKRIQARKARKNKSAIADFLATDIDASAESQDQKIQEFLKARKGQQVAGSKYYKRVATGNVKRPWKYYYTQAAYEKDHPMPAKAHEKKPLHAEGPAERRSVSGGYKVGDRFKAPSSGRVFEITGEMPGGLLTRKWVDSDAPLGAISPETIGNLGLQVEPPHISRNSFIDRFFSEKNLPEGTWEITADDGVPHTISNHVVIEHIKTAPKHEQDKIESVLRKIDFANGDVNHFLKHLSKAIVNNYGKSDAEKSEPSGAEEPVASKQGSADRGLAEVGLTVGAYTDKSIVIGGKTMENLAILKSVKERFGVGLYNKRAGGWIFPSKIRAQVIGHIEGQLRASGADSAAIEAAAALKSAIPEQTKIEVDGEPAEVTTVTQHDNGQTLYGVKLESGREAVVPPRAIEVLPEETDAKIEDAIQSATIETRTEVENKVFGGKPKTKQGQQKTYEFTPVSAEPIGDLGHGKFLSYTQVTQKEITLLSEKAAATQPRPSYIPEIDEKEFSKSGFRIEAVKLGEDKYVIARGEWQGGGSRLNAAKQWEKVPADHQFYYVSRDVLAATQDYYLKRAKFALKQEIEDTRKLFESRGYDPKNVKNKRLKVMKDTRMTHSHQAFMRAVLPDGPAGSDGWRAARWDSKPGRADYFAHLREINKDIDIRINDIGIQTTENNNTYSVGQKTSYGDTNLSKSLLDSHGVHVKRQNGDKITKAEIGEVRDALSHVWNAFGDRSSMARNWGLKISHAGEKMMHARKAVGIFFPRFKAIGVTNPGDTKAMGFTLGHEFAHFMDNYLGNTAGRHYASDNPGHIAGQIASKFRDGMIHSKTSATSSYWTRTCECFARACEQYVAIKSGDEEAYGGQKYYMRHDEFVRDVAPMIEQFFAENSESLKSGVESLSIVDASGVVHPMSAESGNTHIISEFLKSRGEMKAGHKYYRREQTAQGYKYYYTEADYKREHGGDSPKEKSGGPVDAAMSGAQAGFKAGGAPAAAAKDLKEGKIPEAKGGWKLQQGDRSNGIATVDAGRRGKLQGEFKSGAVIPGNTYVLRTPAGEKLSYVANDDGVLFRKGSDRDSDSLVGKPHEDPLGVGSGDPDDDTEHPALQSVEGKDARANREFFKKTIESLEKQIKEPPEFKDEKGDDEEHVLASLLKEGKPDSVYGKKENGKLAGPAVIQFGGDKGRICAIFDGGKLASDIVVVKPTDSGKMVLSRFAPQKQDGKIVWVKSEEDQTVQESYVKPATEESHQQLFDHIVKYIGGFEKIGSDGTVDEQRASWKEDLQNRLDKARSAHAAWSKKTDELKAGHRKEFAGAGMHKSRILDFLQKTAQGATDRIKEFLKGKRAAVGEVRHWASGPHRKEANGWKRVSEPGPRAASEEEDGAAGRSVEPMPNATFESIQKRQEEINSGDGEPIEKAKAMRDLERQTKEFVVDPADGHGEHLALDKSSQDHAVEIHKDSANPSKIQSVSLEDISAEATGQIRKTFDPVQLRELADSIASVGLMAPIVIRPDSQNPGKFKIVAGERRYRALAMLAGEGKIDARADVIVKDLSDREKDVLQLIENHVRANNTPLEISEHYEKLVKTHDMTPKQISEATGDSLQKVKDYLSLQSLAPELKTMLRKGDKTMNKTSAIIISQLPTHGEQIRAYSLMLRHNMTTSVLREQVKQMMSNRDVALFGEDEGKGEAQKRAERELGDKNPDQLVGKLNKFLDDQKQRLYKFINSQGDLSAIGVIAAGQAQKTLDELARIRGEIDRIEGKIRHHHARITEAQSPGLFAKSSAFAEIMQSLEALGAQATLAVDEFFSAGAPSSNSGVIEEFLKARRGQQVAGSKYYKRVPKANGGYKYYYTKQEYERAKREHVETAVDRIGESSAQTKESVQQSIEVYESFLNERRKNGDSPASLKVFEDHLTGLKQSLSSFPTKTKTERLAMTFKKLDEMPPAASHDEAKAQLADALNSVEDAHSGAKSNPEKWETDGRMYPAQADRIRKHLDRSDVTVHESKGHETHIADNGAIHITEKSGKLSFRKKGKDGKHVY